MHAHAQTSDPRSCDTVAPLGSRTRDRDERPLTTLCGCWRSVAITLRSTKRWNTSRLRTLGIQAVALELANRVQRQWCNRWSSKSMDLHERLQLMEDANADNQHAHGAAGGTLDSSTSHERSQERTLTGRPGFCDIEGLRPCCPLSPWKSLSRGSDRRSSPPPCDASLTSQ